MKDTGKNKILLILVIVLAFISIIAIILSLKNNNLGEPNNGNSLTEKSFQKEITELKDEEEFFGIQKILTGYYDNLAKKNSSELYKVLEDSYIENNGITQNNITDKLNNVYESVTFMIKSIYYNANSSVTYYFVNGYLYTSTMDEAEFSYEKNNNYLVIVDENQEYVIKPLDNDINIYQYAKNYNIVEVDFNNNTLFKKFEISEKNKLTLYINEFLNLLFYDTERAYNMLDSETKSKYLNYQDFKNQLTTIYDSISTNIFAYSNIQKDGYIEYKIKDNKQRDIKIIENKPMDYLIGY